MNVNFSPALAQEFRMDPISRIVDVDQFCSILGQVVGVTEPDGIWVSYLIEPNGDGLIHLSVAPVQGSRQLNSHHMQVSLDILQSAFIEPSNYHSGTRATLFDVAPNGTLTRHEWEPVFYE